MLEFLVMSSNTKCRFLTSGPFATSKLTSNARPPCSMVSNLMMGTFALEMTCRSQTVKIMKRPQQEGLTEKQPAVVSCLIVYVKVQPLVMGATPQF